MAANAQAEFHRWLRNQIFKARPCPLARFVLRNAASGHRSGEIEEFDVPSEQMDPEQCEEFGETILATAQRDADSSGTKLQTYMLTACEAGQSTGPRHRFRIRGEGEEEDSGEERPDQAGITSQLMRHTEALMRMATMGSQTTINQLTRQLESAHQTIAKLTADRAQGQEMLEQAKSRQCERELMILEAESEMSRKNALVTTVVSKMENILPVILNKLGGNKMLADKEAKVLKGFVGGLTQEQIMAMASHLTTEQQIALMSMIKELHSSEAS